MLRVVYADVLIGINFLINYLMLFAVAKLCDVRIKRLKIAVAAGVGGVYCCAAYFWNVSFLWAFAAKIAMGGVMVGIAFGFKKNFIRLLLSFCGVTFAFGGCVLAVSYISDGMNRIVDGRNGVYYIQIPFKILLISTLACFALINSVFRRKTAAVGKRISRIRVHDRWGSVSFSALVDTGNNLTDPITNQPVIVAEYQTLREFLPAEVTEVLDSETGENFPLLIDRLPENFKFRLLPYKTVSSQLDMLLIFKPEMLTVDNKKLSGGFVGISPYPISDGGAYSAIMGVMA